MSLGAGSALQSFWRLNIAGDARIATEVPEESGGNLGQVLIFRGTASEATGGRTRHATGERSEI